MNYCILGTNFISDRFEEALKLLGGSAYAVCSRSKERAEEFQKKHGLSRAYSDFEEALSDKKIDAFYIATPNLCHKEQVIRILRAGFHALCEKPIATSEEDLVEMMSEAKRCGKVLLEAMRPAYDEATEIIRRELPKLGRIRRVSLEFCQYSSRYDAFLRGELPNAFNKALGNSALYDIGIYPLHLLVRLFGEPISSVKSCARLRGDFEGAGIMLLKYPDFNATVTYSKISDSVNPSVIEGELGSLTVDKMNSPRRVVLHLRGKEPTEVEVPFTDNNMIYEITAFERFVSGEGDFEAELKLCRSVLHLINETEEII